MLKSFDVSSEEAVEGPDFWLKRSHTYQAREVQEPEKTPQQTRKKGSGGMVEVGRAHPNRCSVQNAHARKNINSNSEDGSGGIWWWVGRDGGTRPPKPMPGSEKS